MFVVHLNKKAFVGRGCGVLLAHYVSPLLASPTLLPVCLELQQLCLPCGHLVFEHAALHLHAFQQPLQLLHLLTPLLRLILCPVQQLRLLGETNAVLA